jgi:pilus assembly protein Flp/PilA
MLSILIKLHSRMFNALRREEGQGLTEYALILVLVSLVAFGALQLLGLKIVSVLENATGKL